MGLVVCASWYLGCLKGQFARALEKDTLAFQWGPKFLVQGYLDPLDLGGS